MGFVTADDAGNHHIPYRRTLRGPWQRPFGGDVRIGDQPVRRSTTLDRISRLGARQVEVCPALRYTARAHQPSVSPSTIEWSCLYASAASLSRAPLAW